jgi:hypothetical protein
MRTVEIRIPFKELKKIVARGLKDLDNIYVCDRPPSE